MPPTLSPCILNKDIDPPTSAMCVTVPRTRHLCPNPGQVPGAWVDTHLLSHFFSVAMVMYLDKATKGRKSLFELYNSRLQSVTTVKSRRAGLGAADHMTPSHKTERNEYVHT